MTAQFHEWPRVLYMPADWCACAAITLLMGVAAAAIVSYGFDNSRLT